MLKYFLVVCFAAAVFSQTTPNPDAESVVESIAKANDVNPLVTEFAKSFVNSFKSPLEYIFDTSIPNNVATALYMNKGVRLALSVNFTESAKAAEALSDGVRATFGKISPQQYAAAYGFTSGQILLDSGYLNENNSTAQGQEYAKLKEKYVLAFRIKPHLDAIEDSCVDFLAPYDLYNAGDVVDLNSVFRRYMYISAGLPPPSN